MKIEVVDLWNFNPSLLCRQLDLIYSVAPRQTTYAEYVMQLPRSMGKTTAVPKTGCKIFQAFPYAIQPMVIPTIKWMDKNAQEKRRYRDAITSRNVYRFTSSAFNRSYSMEKIPYYKKNGLQSW